MTSESAAVITPTIVLALLIAGSPLARAEDSNISSSRTDVETKILAPASYCGNQVLAPEHRYRVFGVRSKAECAVQCARDKDCVSIVYDKGRRECHVGDAKAYSNCSNMEPATELTTYYQETVRSSSSTSSSACQDGKVMGQDGTCVCPPGHSGTPCELGYADCKAILEKTGTLKDGLYTVHPIRHPEPFQVYCRNVKYMRMYVLRRMKIRKNFNFNRSWQEYKDGFGDPAGEFWIGLDKLHALTAERPYKLRYSVILANGTNIDFSYYNFKISDAATGYRLDFNTSILYNNQEDDCFFPLLNAKFSTFDHDRDEDNSVNCAAQRKSGFWFRGGECSRCNPHGIFYHREDKKLEGAEDEVFWHSLGSVPPTRISVALVDY